MTWYKKGVIRDGYLWGAVVAGLAFWGGLLFIFRPDLNLAWPLDRPVAFLVPAALYPVVEEIVFRGFIQEFFVKILKAAPLGPITMANLLTSLLFTAMHLLYHAPLWAAAVFIPSLLFGYFKDKYQSLTPAIFLHAYYNVGYYWLFGLPSA